MGEGEAHPLPALAEAGELREFAGSHLHISHSDVARQSGGRSPPYYRACPYVVSRAEDPWIGGDGAVPLSGGLEPRKRGTPNSRGLKAMPPPPFSAFFRFVRPAATASAVKKPRVQRYAPCGNRQSPAAQSAFCLPGARRGPLRRKYSRQRAEALSSGARYGNPGYLYPYFSFSW